MVERRDLLLRKVHASYQVLESWVGTQMIELGIDFDHFHAGIALFVGCLQELQRSILITQTRVHPHQVEGGIRVASIPQYSQLFDKRERIGLVA